MSYLLTYASTIQKDISVLSPPIAIKIRTVVEKRLAENPIVHGKPLSRSWRGHRRLRVGDYRVIYRINEHENTVHIVAIGHRKDLYDE